MQRVRLKKGSYQVHFETPRLLIRPFTTTDLTDLYHFMKNPKLAAMAGWQPPTSRQESWSVLQMFIRSDEVFALMEKATQYVIGSIGLHRRVPSAIKPEDDSRELSFILGEAYWGRGLMPEAVNAILRYGFIDLKLQEIWVGHFQDNYRSQRVIEKTGFHFEYEFERPRLFSDQPPIEEVYYKLTAADFRGHY